MDTWTITSRRQCHHHHRVMKQLFHTEPCRSTYSHTYSFTTVLCVLHPSPLHMSVHNIPLHTRCHKTTIIPTGMTLTENLQNPSSKLRPPASPAGAAPQCGCKGRPHHNPGPAAASPGTCSRLWPPKPSKTLRCAAVVVVHLGAQQVIGGGGMPPKPMAAGRQRCS